MATSSGKGRVITVDFTGVESGSALFARVPEGDYALEITGVKGKKGQESGKPNLIFTFELSQGPKRGNGKQLGHNCSLQPQSLWNLRQILEACGKQVPSKKLNIDVDKLIGLKCAGTIVDDEYEGRKKSTIAAFYPLDDLGQTEDADEDSSLEDDLGGGEEQEEEEEAPPPRRRGKKAASKKKEEEEEPEGGEEGTDEDELFN